MANSIVVRDGMKEADEHWKYLPPFLWLLRDVLIKMPKRDGKELTPTEYLKTVVLLGDSSKDSVRKALTQFFPSFECQALPPPFTCTDVVKSVSKRQEDLDPKFNQGVDELIALLKDNIKPKKVSDAAGSACDGSTLAALVEQVSEQVNKSDSIPAFDNTWKMVVESRCRAVQERLLTEYSATIKAKYDEASQGAPLEEIADNKCVSLMSIHDSLCSEITKKLNAELRPLLSSQVIRRCTLDSVTRDFQSQLVQFRWENAPHTPVHVWKVAGGALLPVIEENRRRSSDFCNKLFTDLYTPIREKVLTETEDRYTPENLVADIEKLLQEYDAKSVGPEKWKVRAEIETTIKQNKEFPHEHLKEMLKHAKREREQREMHENLRENLQTLIECKKQSDEKFEEFMKQQQEAEECRKQELETNVKELTQLLEEQKQKQERMYENEIKRRCEDALRLSEETFKKDRAKEKLRELEEKLMTINEQECKRIVKRDEEIRKIQQMLEEQKKKETKRNEKAKQEIEGLREKLKEECWKDEAKEKMQKIEKMIAQKAQKEAEEKAKHEKTLREKTEELHQQQLLLEQMKNEFESIIRMVTEENQEQVRLKELTKEETKRTADHLNQVIKNAKADKEKSEKNWEKCIEEKEAETEQLSNNISILTREVNTLITDKRESLVGEKKEIAGKVRIFDGEKKELAGKVRTLDERVSWKRTNVRNLRLICEHASCGFFLKCTIAVVVLCCAVQRSHTWYGSVTCCYSDIYCFTTTLKNYFYGVILLTTPFLF